MPNFLPHLADRVLNRPLLLDPSKAEIILAVLEGRILPGSMEAGDEGAQAGGSPSSALPPEANRLLGTHRRENGYSLTRKIGNSSVITIDGSLVNRGAWVGASSGLTSYEGIEALLMAAATDQETNSIILDINSFGGEATGMFALAGAIRAIREQKPVVALINDTAASAAYGIASSADEIVVSPTSIVGSIGVVMMHLDRSEEMKAKGIRPTFIHAGAHKVDGHPFGPLPESVKAALQRDVGTFYDRFLETVEAGRGARTTSQRARETEARTYIGQQAIEAGLADRIGTLADIVASFKATGQASGRTSQENARMSGENTNTITQEAHTAAVATARKEGAVEATGRIKAILTCEEAKGREPMAQTLALETSMSAEEAAKVLASAPAASTPAPAATTQTIEQRSQGGAEIGAASEEDKVVAAKSGWKAVIDGHNARV
jgi:capsid assembly protease